MSSAFIPELPEILATEEVLVEDEAFRFVTFEGDAFNPVIEQTEYLLAKAPIQRIESVSGVVNETETIFQQGIDYKLSDDNEKLIWIDGGEHPDPGSEFFVTYRSESVLSRYIRSHSEELDSVQEDLEEIVEAKFVDTAEGAELDRIGDIFGTLGRRLGRTDEEYRTYLKSVVQSFISRGTKEDIKTALSAATGVPLENIALNEDFQENEYEVSVIVTTPIIGSLIEQVSEIADPSGVEQSLTRFKVSTDAAGTDDAADISQGEKIDDDSFSDDAFSIGPKESIAPDNTKIVDEAVRNALGRAFDNTASEDAVTDVREASVVWQSNNWGTIDWAGDVDDASELIGIFSFSRSVDTETVVANDSVFTTTAPVLLWDATDWGNNWGGG